MPPAPPCATHAAAPAQFRCDGCGKLLCGECVAESHRLLLCRLCGERALPLAGTAPATVPERRQRDAVAAHAGYTLGDALLYPVRGGGLGMFLVALVIQAVVSAIVFLNRYSLSLRGQATGISIAT